MCLALTKERLPGRPASDSKFDRTVDVRQIKFPGTPHHAEWDTFDPAQRPGIAGEAAAIIRADILPWFERMRDPALAMEGLLVDSISSSLLLYGVAPGHGDAARRRVAALAAERPTFAETLDRLKRDGKPSAYRGVEPIAWTAIECGLA